MIYFHQGASFSQMARLLLVTKRCARGPVTRDPLGKSGVVDLAGMFKLALACFDKGFVDAKLELESLDYGIFGMSHGVQCLNHCARWRDLVKSCNLITRSFHLYHNRPTNETVKSEWNALRTREMVLRSPISIPLSFTAECGGSFRVALLQLHSEELRRRERLTREARQANGPLKIEHSVDPYSDRRMTRPVRSQA